MLKSVFFQVVVCSCHVQLLGKYCNSYKGYVINISEDL